MDDCCSNHAIAMQKRDRDREKEKKRKIERERNSMHAFIYTIQIKYGVHALKLINSTKVSWTW